MAVSNVNAQYKYPTVSGDFVDGRAAQTQTGRLNDIKPAQPEYEKELRYGQPARVGQYAHGPWGAIKKVTHKQSPAYKAGKLWARTRVSAANVWIMSWAMFWYLTFQLPIAVISAIGLGMIYAVHQAISAAVGANSANYILKGMISTGTAISEIISYLARTMFFLPFDPMLLFIAPFALVFLLGLFQLILTWFVYSSVGVKSLSGQHGGLKGVMFILAGIGYAIPILNLFPLIFLWMAFVWKYPK